MFICLQSNISISIINRESNKLAKLSHLNLPNCLSQIHAIKIFFLQFNLEFTIEQLWRTHPVADKILDLEYKHCVPVLDLFLTSSFYELLHFAFVFTLAKNQFQLADFQDVFKQQIILIVQKRTHMYINSLHVFNFLCVCMCICVWCDKFVTNMFAYDKAIALEEFSIEMRKMRYIILPSVDMYIQL